MKLDENRDRYILITQEKRALIWRIERYKQVKLQNIARKNKEKSIIIQQDA